MGYNSNDLFDRIFQNLQKVLNAFFVDLSFLYRSLSQMFEA